MSEQWHTPPPGGVDVAADPATGHQRLGAISAATNHLLASTEPAVVFTSLARLCVPRFSDACTIDIAEEHRAAYRISYPQETPTRAPGATQPSRGSSAREIRTPVRQPGDGTWVAFAGLVVHTWDAHVPTELDAAIAALIVDRAIAAVARERASDVADQALNTVANLQTALLTSRQIGTALGILMASEKITDAAAFERLRSVSQRTHRKLRDIAADVVRTRWLEQP